MAIQRSFVRSGKSVLAIVALGVAVIGFSLLHSPSAVAQTPAATRRQESLNLLPAGSGLTSAQRDAVAEYIASLASSVEEARVLTLDAGRLIESGLRDAQLLTAISISAQARDNANNDARTQQAYKDFVGLKWGLGIAAVIDVSGGERVQEAQVVDGIVRVTKDNSNSARIFAEIHRFRPRKSQKDLAKSSPQSINFGRGFFVGIQSSSEEVIDSIAAGYMWGWRLPQENSGGVQDSSKSLNIGVGLVFDPKVQVLGDGIEKDKPLPGNETEIRYKQESRTGLGLFFSFSF